MIEFRHEEIRQVEVESKSPAQATPELGIVEQTPGSWRKKFTYKAGKLTAGTGKPVTPEQMELSWPKAENSRLKIEVEIINKATSYFEKESL